MLYLLRSFTRTKSYIKVGYTGDIQQRMTSYLVENPGYELITTREGSMLEETKMHLYFTARGWKAEFLEEWFIDIPEALQEFHQSWVKVNNTIWKNRNSLFTAFDFSRRSLKVQIYEELRFKYRGNDEYEVDREWKIWNRKKEIAGRQRLIEAGYLIEI